MSIVTRTFEAPRTYCPSASALGRMVRAWTDDRLRGEALYLVAMAGLTVVLLMAHYLGWALLTSTLSASQTWEPLFWQTQVGSVLVLAGAGLVGFRPAVRVTCQPNAVTLRQGDKTRALSPPDIQDVRLISAQRYHRHYRRYAATQVFASAVPEQVLCVQTNDGPVIVALPESEAQAALLDHVDALAAPTSETVARP